MKITKSQLKQIIREELSEVRLDTQGTPAGKIQRVGTGLGGAATVAAAIFGTPVVGFAVAGAGGWLNHMANKWWSNYKLRNIEATEQLLVTAADDLLGAYDRANRDSAEGQNVQAVIEFIQQDLESRLVNVPDDTKEMLRFEEYEVDSAKGSPAAKAAVKEALRNADMFGKDTWAHKLQRGVDVVTNPLEVGAKKFKQLGDPGSYLSEMKITKSQFEQIIREEMRKVLKG